MTARDFTTADALDELAAMDELTALMDSGLSQYDASRALWSPCPIFDALAREVGARRMRDAVRDGIAARVPWLRLLPGGDES